MHIVHVFYSGSAQAVECTSNVLNAGTVTVCRVDLVHEQLQLFWRDDAGRQWIVYEDLLNSQPGWDEKAEGAVRELWKAIDTQFIVHAPPASDGVSMSPLLAWLEQNLHRDLTLPAIARRAAMSTRTLNRRFREQAGMTPALWVTRARVRGSSSAGSGSSERSCPSSDSCKSVRKATPIATLIYRRLGFVLRSLGWLPIFRARGQGAGKF